MLIDSRRNSQDVWVENDVITIESDLIHQDPVGSLANSNLFLIGCRLSILVEGHHHDRRAVAHDVPRLVLEILLALFQRDRVNDSLPLKILQSLLEDFPLRGVHHDWHFRDIRLALQELQEAAHHRLAINQSIIETDIDDVGAIGDLLARHLDRGFEITGTNELRKLR